ncbi:hypothetical protein Tco_0911658 [Tanacetum coccineum]|uniref:Uncharacterized protein n=1 Tax=Tanacetum coccineum TaxID=301880 RepID=A0ABQ5CYN0_9ASTR
MTNVVPAPPTDPPNTQDESRVWEILLVPNFKGKREDFRKYHLADAVTLLKRIRKFSIAQDIGARAAIHIFNRISFAIAKGCQDVAITLCEKCSGALHSGIYNRIVRTTATQRIEEKEYKLPRTIGMDDYDDVIGAGDHVDCDLMRTDIFL